MGNEILDMRSTEQAASVEDRLQEALYPEAELAQDDVNELPSEESAEAIEGEDAPEDEEMEEGESEESEEDSDDELSLADYLGVPEDRLVVNDDGEIRLLAKIDGELEEVDLKSLVKSYQLEGHVNKKSMALEEERKEWTVQREEATKELRDYADNLTALSQVMEQELFSQFKSVDWDGLRQSNPAEWAAKREEFALRAQDVQTRQQQLKDAVGQLQQQQQVELEQQRTKALKTRDEALIQHKPEWVDEVVRDRDMQALGAFLHKQYGMPEDVIDQTFNAEAIKMALDAKAFREGRETAQAKKQKPVPKFQKSGAAKASAANLAKAREGKAKKAALKRDGSITSAANLLLDRM